MINKVKFGEIVIKGKKYSSDVIIFWDGEVLEKEKSHKITERDIEEILMKEPEIVVIGRGMAGLVDVEENVFELCKKEGVEIKLLLTNDAVEEFNKLIKERKKVAGVFHLTC